MSSLGFPVWGNTSRFVRITDSKKCCGGSGITHFLNILFFWILIKPIKDPYKFGDTAEPPVKIKEFLGKKFAGFGLKCAQHMRLILTVQSQIDRHHESAGKAQWL